jgi:YbbR-like protein
MELPDGVRINSFKPATIQVRLEANLERQLPVEIKLEGQPAAGFEVVRSAAQPEVITVRGPASMIGTLQQAPTERISVEGRKDNFTALGVAITISDSRIEVVNPLVDVSIEIAEKKNPTTAPPIGSNSAFSEHLIAAKLKPSRSSAASASQ